MNFGRGRRRPGVRPLQQNRWAGWAGALRARHERGAVRRTRPSLLLLRRIASILFVVDRRRAAVVQHVGPSIRLAIAVFLRVPLLRYPPRRMLAADAVRDRASRMRTPEQILLAPRPHAAAPDRAASDSRTRAGVPVDVLAPLARVVRRLRASADAHEAAPRLRPSGGRRILRTAGRYERIEVLEPHHRRRGQLLKREAPSVAALPGDLLHRRPDGVRTIGMPARRVTGAFSTDRETIPVAGGVSLSPQSAAVAMNVEELTERVVREIDRRVVAHRERLGRAY